VLGGHEHVYLYRKYGNSILLKSGVNFKTFSNMTISFEESEENTIIEKLIPKANIFKIKEFIKTKIIDESSSGESVDSMTDSENYDFMQDYVSSGDKTDSYKSDLYFNDNKFKTKMMAFQNTITNDVDNQFNETISINVERVDIDKKDYDKSLEEEESYKVLKEHVKSVLDDLFKKGKEKMFYLLDDVDLTSNSVRTRENNMANWVCRLIQIESGAQVAICTGGSLRSMQKFSKNHVFTLMDLNKMTAIIDNYEFVMVKGSHFVKILENGYRGLPNALGSFMHFAGANVTIDQNEKYDEDEVLKRESDLFSKRIKNVTLDIDEFDPEKNILLVGLHFMVEGKDGFTAFNLGKRLGIKDINMTNNEQLSSFFRCANDEKIQKEFALLKKFINPYITDSVIRVVQQKNDPYKYNEKLGKLILVKKKRETDLKKAEYLTEEIMKEHGLMDEFDMDKFKEMINKLRISALKRLRKYLIIHGIREVEGTSIFEISPKFYDKVVVKST
jgi:hypothetical protein